MFFFFVGDRLSFIFNFKHNYFDKRKFSLCSLLCNEINLFDSPLQCELVVPYNKDEINSKIYKKKKIFHHVYSYS